MASRHINYLSRDFDAVRDEIISFSKENYPQLSDNFGNDASVSSWLVDLMSDCVDSLNYHIDRTFQDTQINSTTSKTALMNIARSNGLKIPGPKGGMCEVTFSCILPVGYYQFGNKSTDISQPNWNIAPVIQRNCVVSAGNLNYTIDENVDFFEQFNADACSNRTYTPRRNANGVITGYTVTKKVIATAGTRKVYKKIITDKDVSPFMEIMLPEKNVMNIESIIFKPMSNLNTAPEISEYYVDEEEFFFRDGGLKTYRYFEVDALTDQWRWGSEISGMDEQIIRNKYNCESYVDYTESGKNDSVDSDASRRTTRYYKGQWKPLRQKFITEYTDNGYLKIIFGAGVDYKEFPSDNSVYSQYRMARVMNNDMLGVLPKEGWTMFVLYNVGGGVETNVAKGAINTIKTMQVDFPHSDSNADTAIRSEVLRSMKVTNNTIGLAGKDTPSAAEIKHLIKYNTGAQGRCVTLKDYQCRVMSMPPKYGSPYRCIASEENNKIVLNVLGMSSNGNLSKALPSTLVENMEKYLTHYKSINDYVEIKSGKVYNLGFLIDVFVDKSYNSADVVASVIKTVKDYMDVDTKDMGEDIFVGDLNKEISMLDGVISLIDMKIYKINGGSYSTDICPLPTMEDTASSVCGEKEDNGAFYINGAKSERIDLDSIDSVLLGDSNAMYEVRNPNIDIQVRIKSK